MPEISRFFGIIIKMFFLDHAPPHFHAEYGNYRVVIDILTQDATEGYLPPRQLKLVQAWAVLPEKELLSNFESLSRAAPSWNKIDPLR